jgi:hypothetical protein
MTIEALVEALGEAQKVLLYKQDATVKVSMAVDVTTAQSAGFLSVLRTSIATSFTTATLVEAAAVYITCVKGEGVACFVPDTVPISGRRRRLSKTFIDVVISHTEDLGPSLDIMGGSTAFLATLQQELAKQGFDIAIELESPASIVTTIQFRPEDMAAPLPTASELGPTVSHVETLQRPLSRLSGATSTAPADNLDKSPARQVHAASSTGATVDNGPSMLTVTVCILVAVCCVGGVCAGVAILTMKKSGVHGGGKQLSKHHSELDVGLSGDFENPAYDQDDYGPMEMEDGRK